MTGRKVCYLIPVYNDQAGLDISLESILVERVVADIVVVDDGSLDPVKIRREFTRIGERTLTLIRLPENRGITSALNAGLRHILAQDYGYLARLDAADTVASDRLSKQCAFLDANLDVGLVSSDVEFEDSRGRILYTHRTPTVHDDIVEALRFNNCLLHPSVTIRVDVMRQVGYYNVDMRVAEDYDLFLRICRIARVASLPYVLTTTKFNPEGLTLSLRRPQQWQRLRLQARYFDARKITAYLGMARTIACLAVPTNVVIQYKLRRQQP